MNKKILKLFLFFLFVLLNTFHIDLISMYSTPKRFFFTREMMIDVIKKHKDINIPKNRQELIRNYDLYVSQKPSEMALKFVNDAIKQFTNKTIEQIKMIQESSIAKQEQERKTREEEQKRKQEESERKTKQEQERKAKQEAERKAKQEREEKERKAKEQEQKRLEEERKAKEEAERKAREEQERIAKEQEQKRLEEERKAKEEAERKAREEQERKAKEQEQKRLEEERKAKEEAERKAREEQERIAKEQEQKRLEEERKAKKEELKRNSGKKIEELLEGLKNSVEITQGYKKIKYKWNSKEYEIPNDQGNYEDLVKDLKNSEFRDALIDGIKSKYDNIENKLNDQQKKAIGYLFYGLMNDKYINEQNVKEFIKSIIEHIANTIKQKITKKSLINAFEELFKE